MKASRGMGAILPSKTPRAKPRPKMVPKRDGAAPVKLFKKGGRTRGC